MRTTKDAVISILKNGQEYISGERISRTLGISRAAVHTAIQSLRQDGYQIASVTNRGYLLTNAPDLLTDGEMRAELPQNRMCSVECLQTVDSTNLYLRNLAQNGAPDGQVVLADNQTGGRGRLGRSFSSPGGVGIYMSMLMRPECLPAEATALTAWTAVAVRDAISAIYGVAPGIKWVNDLVLNRKKVCGILTEMSVEGESGHIQYVIIGIGVNVNEQLGNFPEEIRAKASSLLLETGRRVGRARLAAELIRRLDQMRADWPVQRGRYLEAYRASSVTTGHEVRLVSVRSEKQAFAERINEQFGLTVRYPDGATEEVSSGEVSVRGLYDYLPADSPAAPED